MVANPLEQLVRHFLIETGPRGVKIKGCQNEPHFGELFNKNSILSVLAYIVLVFFSIQLFRHSVIMFHSCCSQWII